MNNGLRITIVQPDLAWENAEKNRVNIAKLLKKINKTSTDLIVLPEMFASGFTMSAVTVAEEMNGPTMNWMREQAKSVNAVICGSLVIKEKKKFYNRLIWMKPDGKYLTYDKRHLFRMAHEDQTYTAGTDRLIVNLNGWKICPLVCYDLRFPVWSRNKNNEYDVLIYVANWPEKRRFAWKQLLCARAIENQSYVVGVNRVGFDGNKIPYVGDSVVHDPLGKKINKAKPHAKGIETIELNYKKLNDLRASFPVALDADQFTFNMKR